MFRISNLTQTIVILSLLISFFANCRKEPERKNEGLGILLLYYLRNHQNPDSPSVYFSTVRQLNLEVAYEPGAEPEIGNFTLGGSSYWSVTEDNLKAIFADRGYSVGFSIPSSLSNMKSIPSQNRSLWSISDILALSAKYQSQKSDYATARFFLVLVHGYYNDNGTASQSTIGLNISGTPVTVVFKDVVDTFSTTTRPIAEQVTVIHEIGHALGFVNGGVPLSTMHQDTANGKHCSNTKCAMYYQVESQNSIVNFVQSYINKTDKIMFQSECLDDAKNYKP
ncbi:hypothetical protein LPTSP3_g06360 [Leptospira kobayashii]|uniref:Lipoprotein n=1 Tax=Leptospira kobayashii TaxID=1917830 RepID=A0ABN6KDJ2_9LEPT|nr:hypothetical protein [Leptospira kobayashii]BDA77706.1 hypothetical protein LPTSP3_g06360 [Leptospira kobayashii]